jgi:hypothetical protein
MENLNRLNGCENFRYRGDGIGGLLNLKAAGQNYAYLRWQRRGRFSALQL